ncbi:DUF4153 domain-containing protein [Sandarakinorhabdus sp. DWP1-3-1]|uniref:DUF4153 domain-containing protein n=1 Tax=Sandarakinorhabdus sp. DWP1-3-1 TaxID=2804627 RepID=UPI003CF426AB
MAEAASQGWPARSWGLTIAGAAIGVAIDRLLPAELWRGPPPPDALAFATFLAVAGLCIALLVERTGNRPAVVFALLAAAVVAGVTRTAGIGVPFGPDPWRLLWAVVAVAVATPLFQAWRSARPHGGGLPYAVAHERAWTDLLLLGAGLVFVGIVWTMALLLAELFNLIGIAALKTLLDKRLFGWALTGAALGGGIGLLRERDAILATLKRVVTTVLAVLAPVLAAGLVVFILSLPFTGLTPLWQATRSTTPILLSCVWGALVLVNTVIGDGRDEEARSRVLRGSAVALSATLLFLGVIAAVSVAARIRQHGISPDRLWAVTVCGIACAYGLAYLVALLRGRAEWMAVARQSNLNLAIGLGGLALLLASPMIDFGAIATRDQLARLQRGAVTAEKFDLAALRFDFGPAGVAATRALARTGTPAIRAAATAALVAESKYKMVDVRQRAEQERRWVFMPAGIAPPQALLDALRSESSCGFGSRTCLIMVDATKGEAIVVPTSDIVNSANIIRRQANGKWLREGWGVPRQAAKETVSQAAIERAIKAGRVEVRTVPQRQVFVDGQPIGEPFP